MMKLKEINRTFLFIVITFILSYSLAGVYILLGGDPANRLGFTLLGALYMFVPALSVLIVMKAIHREKIMKSLNVSFRINRWFFVAWLSMPALTFLSIGISLLFPDVAYSPDMTGMLKRFSGAITPEQRAAIAESLEKLPVNPVLFTLGQGLLAGITVNAVAAFGEELGWRGFLLRQFREMPFYRAASVIGFIWGIWHAPLILMGHNYPRYPKTGVFLMVLFCVLLSFLFQYIAIKARSVIAAAVMHGTMNATAGISLMVLDGGHDLVTGITGVAGFAALFCAIGLFFIYDYYVSKEKIFLKPLGESMKNASP